MPDEKPEKPSPLEELGRAINEQVEKTGRVRGEVSFTENSGTARKYLVTKTFRFSDFLVEEQAEYKSPWRLRENVIQDCIEDIRRVVNHEYKVTDKPTSGLNAKEITIAKLKTNYDGMPFMHPSWHD